MYFSHIIQSLLRHPCLRSSIKVSTLSHKPAQVLANIQSAIPAIVKHIKGGWDNVQSFNIKTNSSVSLPIWSCRLDGEEGGRWDGFTAKNEQSEGEEEEEEEKDSGEEEKMEVDEDSTKTKNGTKKSGLKRAPSSDEEEEEEKPKKKSKGVKDIPVAVPPTPKKKSIPIPYPVAAPSSAKITQVAAAHVDTPAKSKKRMVAAAPSIPTLRTTTADVLSTKQAKKSKTDTVSAPEPLPCVEPSVKITPTSEPISVPGDKKKKKKVAATVNVEPSPSSAEVILKKKEKKFNSSLEASPIPSVPIASKKMKEKKKAKSDQANPAPAKTTEISAVGAVTKEEHKQKRSGGAGEKKKEKVAKLKGGKSAKDALLGKKAGQSL